MIVWEYGFLFDEEGNLANYEEVGLVNYDEDNTFYARWNAGVRGEPLPKMELRGIYKRSAPKSDFPVTAARTIFSEKAILAFNDKLKETVKYLQINCDSSDKYYLVDIPVIDCLDYEKSVIKYSEIDRSKILNLKRFAFKTEIVTDKLIFQIPESRSRIFVTDQFIEEAKVAGLVGVNFIKIWDSETGISYPYMSGAVGKEELRLE